MQQWSSDSAPRSQAGLNDELPPELTGFATPIIRVAEVLIEEALKGNGFIAHAEIAELIGTIMLREARHAQARAIEGHAAGAPADLACFLAEDDMGYQTVSVLCGKVERTLP